MNFMLSHFMKAAQLPPHCLIYYFPDINHLFKVPPPKNDIRNGVFVIIIRLSPSSPLNTISLDV